MESFYTLFYNSNLFFEIYPCSSSSFFSIFHYMNVPRFIHSNSDNYLGCFGVDFP